MRKRLLTLSLLILNSLMFTWFIAGQATAQNLPSAGFTYINTFADGGSLKGVNNLCVPTAVPFFEGFEAGFYDNDSVFPCWNNLTSTPGGILWLANNTSFTYNRTPRTGAWNACLEADGSGWMIRNFQLTGGTSYTVDLWARQDYQYDVYLEVKYGTDSTIAAMTQTIIPYTAVADGQYQLFTGTFTPATTGVYYIGFHGDIISFDPWYLSIDDISVYETPSCMRPDNLSVSNLTPLTATVGWIDNNIPQATQWQIQYGPSGFTPGTGIVVTTGTNPHSLTSLSANTHYDFYVRAICSAGDTSMWSSPGYFTTLCENFTTFPLIEGFEGPPFPPECWMNYSIVGVNVWDSISIGEDPDCMPHSGTKMARWNSYDITDGNTAVLVSPAMNIPANGYIVKFWIFRDDNYDSNLDRVNVYYNTSPSLAGATLLGTVHRAITLSPIVATVDWYFYQYQLPMGSMGNSRYVIFEGVSDWGYNIFIDDIFIGSPGCSNPTGLNVVSTVGSTATLNWTSAAPAWKVQYGPHGFQQGTGIKLPAATKPFSITGLADGCYQAYVQAVCSLSDTSDWIGPVSFCICNSVYIPDYTEGFESPLFPPVCWQVDPYNPGPYFTWYSETFNSYSGTRHAQVEPAISSGQQDEWLYSPKFDISSLQNAQLKFAWFGNKNLAIPPQNKYDLNVLISVNNGPFNLIWNELQTDLSTWTTQNWRLDSINLFPYLGSITVQFAFQYFGMNGSAVGIDSVILEELPAFYDIGVSQSDVIECDTLGWFYPPINFKNSGFEVIPSGTSISVSYRVDLGTWVTENFTTLTALNPGDAANYTFATPYHFNDWIMYHCQFAVDYANDLEPLNDTVEFTLSIGDLQVELGPPQTVCNDQSTFLGVNPVYDSYLWSTGATGVPNIIIDSTGYGPGTHTFWVEVTLDNCTERDSIEITFDICTDVIEQSTFHFHVYPNPSTGMFNVEYGGFIGNIHFEIYSMQGQLVYRELATENNAVTIKQMDLTELPRGMYMLKVRDDSHQLIRRIITE